MSDKGIPNEQESRTSEIQPPEPTLRDDLRASLNEIKERDGDGSDAAKIDAAERKRDEKTGQFTPGKAQKRETLTMPAKPSAETAGVVAAPAAPVDPAVAPEVKAPASWKAELKAQFTGLSPEVQAEINRREQEISRTLSRVDEERTFGKKMIEATQPYQATFKAHNADVTQAWPNYLQTINTLTFGTPQQKQQALLTVAQQYNVPLGASQNAPQITGLETLQQRLDRIERERQEEATQRQAAEDFQLQSEVEAFKAEQGHEHFEQVRAHMGHLLQEGMAESMQDAYDQAVWANKEIRESLIAGRTAEAQRGLQTQAKTDAAKRAAGSVIGAPGGAKPVSKANGEDRTLRDELKASFAEHSGGRI